MSTSQTPQDLLRALHDDQRSIADDAHDVRGEICRQLVLANGRLEAIHDRLERLYRLVLVWFVLLPILGTVLVVLMLALRSSLG